MKRFGIILIALLIQQMGLAQGSAAEAKTLLDDVSVKVQSYENITIDFRFAVHEDGQTTQETRGDVVLQGKKYVLNILGITRIYDGEVLYTINPEDEEVTISRENSDDENHITPNTMLSFYTNGYTYAMDIVQDVSGRKIQYVKLTPTNQSGGIDYILLGIDQKTHHVYNLIEVGERSRTTLTVNSFKTNQPLSETLFTFDEEKYSNYYINRLD